MLSRLHRFHGLRGLDVVYRRGQTIRGPLSSVRYYDNPKRHAFRVAVVVSKKVHKSAVTRNRIRRRIYEIIRHHQTELGALDIVFSVFDESIATMPAADLERTVVKQLQKLPRSN